MIRSCISSVSFSLMINGRRCVSVIPHRGLRQGDLLSAYLFILCADGMASLVNRVEALDLVRGFQVARGAPSVSHLLFTDDSLLFFRAKQ